MICVGADNSHFCWMQSSCILYRWQRLYLTQKWCTLSKIEWLNGVFGFLWWSQAECILWLRTYVWWPSWFPLLVFTFFNNLLPWSVGKIDNLLLINRTTAIINNQRTEVMKFQYHNHITLYGKEWWDLPSIVMIFTWLLCYRHILESLSVYCWLLKKEASIEDWVNLQHVWDLVPQAGIEPWPPVLENQVLATGLPEKSCEPFSQQKAIFTDALQEQGSRPFSRWASDENWSLIHLSLAKSEQGNQLGHAWALEPENLI